MANHQMAVLQDSYAEQSCCILQAWAIMEEEDGNLDAARELFEKATVADPHHTPVWQVRLFCGTPAIAALLYCPCCLTPNAVTLHEGS